LALPSSIFISAFWSVFVARYYVSAAAKVELELYSKAIFSGAFRSEWMPNRYLLILKKFEWAEPYFRFSLPVTLLFSRVTIFGLLERPRLKAITRRLRDSRLAESFDYVSPSELLTNKYHRFDLEISYQYQPWWTVGIPAAYTAYCYAFSYKGEALKLAGKLGIVMCFETLGRMLGETVWRYFGLDSPTPDSSTGPDSLYANLKEGMERQVRATSYTVFVLKYLGKFIRDAWNDFLDSLLYE
jgi:hypothetical protein